MLKPITGMLVVSFFLVNLTACQRQEETPKAADVGPAEAAGAKIDAAAEKLRPALNKVGEKVGQALQKGGEKLEDDSKDAQKKE